MSPSAPRLSELRPGMEHLTFRVKVTKVAGVRKVKVRFTPAPRKR